MSTTAANAYIGPIVSKLREIYFGIVRGENERYLHWCTPVFPER